VGAQLLHWTSRSLTLTEAGRDFYESAVRLVGDVEAAESRVGRGRTRPSGLVRATVVPVFGRLYIVPRLRAFFDRYPEVAVELVVADRLINLVEEGVDVGVHNGELSDSSLIARKIARTPVVTVATPAYLAAHGVPATPSDLDRHACVIYAPQGAPRVWGFRRPVRPDRLSAQGRLPHQRHRTDPRRGPG
jgi:DNA-binding transcriptional LysR family regulator